MAPLRWARPMMRAGLWDSRSAMRASGMPRAAWPSLSITGSRVSRPGQPGEAAQMPPALDETSRWTWSVPMVSTVPSATAVHSASRSAASRSGGLILPVSPPVQSTSWVR